MNLKTDLTDNNVDLWTSMEALHLKCEEFEKEWCTKPRMLFF